ncbi:MAG: hypothetical protein QXQ57_00490 [Sulfolobales archaeon]
MDHVNEILAQDRHVTRERREKFKIYLPKRYKNILRRHVYK